jgi:hypothetical protein
LIIPFHARKEGKNLIILNNLEFILPTIPFCHSKNINNSVYSRLNKDKMGRKI